MPWSDSAVTPDRPLETTEREHALPPPPRHEVRRPSWRARLRRWLLWLLLLILLAIAVLYFLRVLSSHPPHVALPPVGVVATRAHLGSIGVYVDGLGTVVPVYTVNLLSRVDGELIHVLYQEGQLVHQGDLLAEVDPRPFQTQLTQFQGALVRDQALLANARVDLARYTALLPNHAVPEQTYATQKSLVEQYEGNVKSDEGQIQSAELNIAYCRITSPINGRVGLRLVDPGNVITANSTPIAVITQLTPTTVVFTISEQQLPKVRQKSRTGTGLPVDAYDTLMKNVLGHGRLLTIDNQIDPTTGTIRLRATFPNTNGALYANQFVNARLQLEVRHNVVLIPNAAIQMNGTATYVWVVQPDSTVVNRPVTLGAGAALESQVLSGVKAGEVVVTEGVDRLREGAKVRVQISQSPPAPQASTGPGGIP
jgi:membrane fusion protein, multidrug efflux system